MSGHKITEFFSPLSSRSVKRVRSNSSPELASDSRRAKMEEQLVGNLTLGQLTEVFSGLLDQKINSLVSKADFEQLTSEVNRLSDSNMAIMDQLHHLKRENHRMSAKLVDLESRARRNNLIFKGLKWGGRQVDYKQVVKQFCIDMFGCGNNVWVNRAHPLGNSKNTLIAHFPDDYDYMYIISNTSRLKGTGFVVHRDYPLEIREKRAHLIAIRSEIERVVGGKRRMPINFDSLIVNDCRFSWRDGGLWAGRQNGVEKLLAITGHDFSSFVSGLSENGPQKNLNLKQNDEERAPLSTPQQQTKVSTQTPLGQLGTTPTSASAATTQE